MTRVENDSKSVAGVAQGTKCSICGKTFDDIAEMQKHVTVEHMQKGEIPTLDRRTT